MSRPSPRFSVIVPMKDEAPNVAAMADEIGAACASLAPFEAIFVNDGSRDDTAGSIRAAQAHHPWLRVLHHRESCGQSAALLSGVRAAQAPVCVTLDGDGQNPPAEIPAMVQPLLDDADGHLGLVAGQRGIREDRMSRRIASRAANALRRRLLHDDARDTGCGLKAFPRAVFLALPYFDHIHRYLPALVRREGWTVAWIAVDHRPRRAGRSHYSNLGRAMVGALDLIGVWWLMRRRKRPTLTPEDSG
ncbi:MAG: glycosyltransferase family 2 protein [Pseudomonadota bacterium]